MRLQIPLQTIMQIYQKTFIKKKREEELRYNKSFSVTLLLLTINCILGELGNGVDGSLFADDVAIYITIRSQRMAARALQGVSNKLDTWAAEWGLTFFPNKTVGMLFRNRSKRNEEPLEIMLRNENIPSKGSTQFLGMTLDSRLN